MRLDKDDAAGLLTNEQLAAAMGPSCAEVKDLVAVRLDCVVLSWLSEQGPGYSMCLDEILRVANTKAFTKEPFSVGHH